MEDVGEDFARLHGVAQLGASGFDVTKTHPLFSTVHSHILAHRYGQQSPQTYMNNPGLRTLDTREAAYQSMKNLPSNVRRYSDLLRPSIPGPVQPTPAPNQPTVPTAYTYPGRRQSPTVYSQRMTPPGVTLP